MDFGDFQKNWESEHKSMEEIIAENSMSRERRKYVEAELPEDTLYETVEESRQPRVPIQASKQSKKKDYTPYEKKKEDYTMIEKQAALGYHQSINPTPRDQISDMLSHFQKAVLGEGDDFAIHQRYTSDPPSYERLPLRKSESAVDHMLQYLVKFQNILINGIIVYLFQTNQDAEEELDDYRTTFLQIAAERKINVDQIVMVEHTEDSNIRLLIGNDFYSITSTEYGWVISDYEGKHQEQSVIQKYLYPHSSVGASNFPSIYPPEKIYLNHLIAALLRIVPMFANDVVVAYFDKTNGSFIFT